VYWSAATFAVVPPAVVTAMYTAPVACGGATAVIWVEETTLKLVAASVPNATFVAPVNPVPVIVTVVPPVVGPDVGEIFVITGLGAAT